MGLKMIVYQLQQRIHISIKNVHHNSEKLFFAALGRFFSIIMLIQGPKYPNIGPYIYQNYNAKVIKE
jgi:hypothetical protein